MNAWVDVGSISDIFGDGPCRGLLIDGLKIGLFDVDGEIFAVDDLCTHGNALLTEGDLDGYEIECPLHAGLFDVRSGEALCAPLTRDVRRHAVKREGERVFVQVAE